MRKMPGDGRLSFIPAMMPTLVDKPPEGDGWIPEVKFDGYRTQLIIDPKGSLLHAARLRLDGKVPDVGKGSGVSTG